MMKGKTNLAWRIAIALVLTVTMGLTATVPVAAAYVTDITIVSPTTAVPVWATVNGTFVTNFTTTGTGNGTVQLNIVNATGTSYSVLAATNVTDISSVTRTATVPAGVPDGVYNLTVQAKNETQEEPFIRGSTGAVKIFSGDTTAPVFAISAQDWEVSNHGSYVISWTMTEDHPGATPITINLYKGSTLIQTITNSTSQTATTFNWSTGIPTVLGIDYRFNITATDAAGNPGSAYSPYFSIYAVDNTLPFIALTNPEIHWWPETEYISGAAYNVTAWARDSQSRITSVQFAYSTNGTGWTNINPLQTTPTSSGPFFPTYSVPFNTTAITSGTPIWVRANATNTVNAPASSINDDVVVDNVKPSVVLNTPANATVTQSTFTMAGTATDATSGFNHTGVKFQYKVNPEDSWNNLWTFSSPTNSTTHTYTHSVSPDVADNATILLRVFAQDKAGNWENSSISIVHIDNTQPTVPTVITPNGGEVWNINATYNITWTVPTDDHFGNKSIVLVLFRNQPSETPFLTITPTALAANGTAGNTTVGVYPWKVPALVPGENYLVGVRAFDLSGNLNSDVSDAYFTIWGTDSTPPSSVTLTPPGAYLRDEVTLSGTAIDNETSIQKMIFKYSLDNGTEWFTAGEDCIGPSWSICWDTEDIEHFNHGSSSATGVLIEAIAVNGVGESTTSNPATVCIDNTCPDVAIVTIPEYVGALPSIKGSANDTPSGIASVKLKIIQEHGYYFRGCWYHEDHTYWNGTAWVSSENTWVNATYTAATHKWTFNSSSIPFSSEDYDAENYWEYTVVARATDNAGNQNFDVECSFYYRYYDYLNLYPGWNFISIPSRPSNASDTFGELFAGRDVAEAWAYNPNVSGGWVEITPTTPVEVLSAYWVYMDAGEYETIKFSYATYDRSVPPAKVLKGDAWNAVGPSGPWVWYYEDCSYSVYNELKSIEGSWSNMVDWDAQDQCYEDNIIAPGYTGYGYNRCDEWLYCGKGYWLFVSNPNGDTLSASIMGESSD